MEETAVLLGKALGSAVGADAVMVPIGGYREGQPDFKAGVTGKLYAGNADIDAVNIILPATDGACAVMTMTGKQANEVARAGYDAAGDGQEPFPYILVVRGEEELEDDISYQVAFLMHSYTEEVGQTYTARKCEGTLREFLIAWLKEQGTVSPGQNP